MADRGRIRPDDLLRATVELGLARLRLRHHRPAIDDSGSMSRLDARQAALVDRVAYIMPRVAVRLPWRADCLVQAMAARRWLTRAGITTRLTLGVPMERKGDFEAHAWLSVGDRVVTGGDVSGYVPFEKP